VDDGARQLGVPALPDHYFDAESGLWLSLFRAFDPASGRYLSPNPLGLAAGPHLDRPPLDPIRERVTFGVGGPREPFWSELEGDLFDARWVRTVLRELVSPIDPQGGEAWRPLDDFALPEPGRTLLEHAGLASADSAGSRSWWWAPSHAR
jgi:hypothetical protein